MFLFIQEILLLSGLADSYFGSVGLWSARFLPSPVPLLWSRMASFLPWIAAIVSSLILSSQSTTVYPQIHQADQSFKSLPGGISPLLQIFQGPPFHVQDERKSF